MKNICVSLIKVLVLWIFQILDIIVMSVFIAVCISCAWMVSIAKIFYIEYDPSIQTNIALIIIYATVLATVMSLRRKV